MEISPRHVTAGVGQMSWNVSETLRSNTASAREIPRHHLLFIWTADYRLQRAMKYASLVHANVCNAPRTRPRCAREVSSPGCRHGPAADRVRQIRDSRVRRSRGAKDAYRAGAGRDRGRQERACADPLVLP